MMSRTRVLSAAALAAVLAAGAIAILTVPGQAASKDMILYKDPNCGCCAGHAAYLEQHGYRVTVVPTNDIGAVKARHGVPETLESCHTTLVDGYVVEGHVPYESIDKLLAERPAVKGISLPGMPQGSPGMNGIKTGPFVVKSFGEGGATTYDMR